MQELAKVTRFEVIDHRDRYQGRAYQATGNNLKVETSVQDNDRTLKVFITDTKAPIPTNRAQINQFYAYNLLKESRVEGDEELDTIIKNLAEYIEKSNSVEI